MVSASSMQISSKPGNNQGGNGHWSGTMNVDTDGQTDFRYRVNVLAEGVVIVKLRKLGYSGKLFANWKTTEITNNGPYFF